MNNIEVGEYVRINKGRFLGTGKVIKKVANTIYIKMSISLPISFPEDELKKYNHSKNIIDLIEVGDYVNYERILDITGEYIKTTETIHNKYCLSNNIKSILTKEQFKQGEFIVEE